MIGRRSERPIKRQSLLAANLRSVNERLLISTVREHESAELALAGQAQLSALVEALHEAVLTIGDDGEVLTLNSAARALTGLVPGARALLDGVPVLDLRPVDKRRLALVEDPFSRAQRGESFRDEEMYLLQANGEVRRIMASGNRIATAHGPVSLIVLCDVTERHRLESELVQSERLAALGTLSGGMAHEINNPLAVAIGNVELALEALPAIRASVTGLGADAAPIASQLGELATALEKSKAGAQRIDEIVHDLSRFGRLELSEGKPLALEPVLERAVRLTAHRWRGIASIERRLGPTPLVVADEGQLVQLFANLLLNAADALCVGGKEASAPPHEIQIATFTDDRGRAVVEVRDDGPGIAPELVPRIFDPFFTTKVVGQGIGLGLAVSHSIAESLGGQISVESEPGEGAVFRVVLPAAPEAPAVPSPVAPIAGAQGRRGRVLVIDDEQAVAGVISRILRNDNDVVLLDNASAALARLATGEAFDIILCDLMMPGMGGIELYQAMVEQHPARLGRLVFLSGGVFTERAAAFVREVENPTLMKPLSVTALREIVARYVERAIASEAT